MKTSKILNERSNWVPKGVRMAIAKDTGLTPAQVYNHFRGPSTNKETRKKIDQWFSEQVSIRKKFLYSVKKGKGLKKAVKETGVKIGDIASESGISVGTLSGFINGKNKSETAEIIIYDLLKEFE